MRAIVITAPGAPDVLALRDDVPAPEPRTGELLVRVHATALNRADLLQRRGLYPPPPGAPKDIPGLEYAGTIEQVGADVLGWRAGERVMGLVGGGSYAEYVAVSADQVLRVPERLTLEQAAAIPEAYLTAHDALFTQAHATSGESVLVHAIASGVGVALLQLARAFGLSVIGTSRSAWKLERLRALGLEHALEVAAPGFADAVLRATDGRGVDNIIDLVGGDYLRDNVRALASRGRLVIVGLVAGRTAELDMGAVLSKRLRIIGTAMRSRSAAEKAAVTHFFAQHALPLFEAGTLEPVVDEVVAIADVADAHRRMEANENVGKIVLTV
jgi:putative PIG3 family NAD(P)H quinone oxidoreductase